MPEYCYHCTQPNCPSHGHSVIHAHGMTDAPLLGCSHCGHWLMKQPLAAVIVGTSKTKAIVPDLKADSPPHRCSGPSCCFHHVDEWFAESETLSE